MHLFFYYVNNIIMKLLIIICMFFVDKIYAVENEVHLLNLNIDGYDIKFDENIYDYYIDIGDEKNLNIEYELSNDNAYVSIIGNGNFNRSENIITINVNNNKTYKVHALKTLNVSLINEVKEERPTIKKEIAKYIIITISCISIFIFIYLMFNKRCFYI